MLYQETIQVELCCETNWTDFAAKFVPALMIGILQIWAILDSDTFPIAQPSVDIAGAFLSIGSLLINYSLLWCRCSGGPL